jgi:hypothetical protein
MSDELKEWLGQQNQELINARNQLESDRLIFQGRQEALLAVMQHLGYLDNENTEPEGKTEQGPTAVNE